MKNPVTFTTLPAETHEQFLALQQDLLRQGFSLFLIEGRRMKYDRWEGIQQHRVDIFMKFWEVPV
jgi:hypothetical protein